MNTVIVTGGNINEEFIKEFFSNNKFNIIVAVDKGLEILNKLKIDPDFIIGDFDSVNESVLKEYNNKNTIELEKEKDFTDTHMALKLAIEKKSTSITIIGAIGTRFDHTLANVHILKEALDNNIKAKIIDEKNEITLINNNTTIARNNRYKYVSIIPLTTEITGITLKGFKYLLEDATLKIGQSIGISNEQIEEEATIKIEKGIAILFFSKD